MVEWLGNNNYSRKEHEFADYNKCSAFVKKCNLQSVADWHRYCRSEITTAVKKPDWIPAQPSRFFEKKVYGVIGMTGLEQTLSQPAIGIIDHTMMPATSFMLWGFRIRKTGTIIAKVRKLEFRRSRLTYLSLPVITI